MKMTPDQRSRYILLASMATLSSVEQIEFTSLKSIAQATGELEELDREVEAAGSEESAGEGEGETPPAGSKQKKPSVASQVKGVITPRSTLIQRNSELNKQLGELRADLARRDQELAGVQAELDTTQAQLKVAMSNLGTVQNQLLEAKRDSKAGEEMVEDALAGASMKQEQLPAPGRSGGDTVPSTRQELEEALAECQTHKERSALLRKFKAAQKAA